CAACAARSASWSAIAAPRSKRSSASRLASSWPSRMRSSRGVARRARRAFAKRSYACANETKLVRPPQRWAASIGHTPPARSEYAPTMISLERIPSSMARRVRTGRPSIARRRSSIGGRARDIGLRASKATPPPARWKVVRRRGKATCMKLGVHIGYWGLGLTSQDQLEIVQEAERLGYDSVWTAEAYGSDAATILGWLAGQTSTIKIGSAILQMPARSPAMTA